MHEQLIQTMSSYEGVWSGLKLLPLWELLENAEKNEDLELSSLAPWIPFSLLHPGRTALAVWPRGKNKILIAGYVGELNPFVFHEMFDVAADLNLRVAIGEWCCFEDYWHDEALKTKVPRVQRQKVKSMSRFPLVQKDLSLVFDRKVPMSQIMSVISKNAGPHFQNCECIDLYPVSDEEHSLSFRMFLQSEEGTLDDQDIKRSMDNVIKKLENQLSARLRS